MGKAEPWKPQVWVCALLKNINSGKTYRVESYEVATGRWTLFDGKKRVTFTKAELLDPTHWVLAGMSHDREGPFGRRGNRGAADTGRRRDEDDQPPA